MSKVGPTKVPVQSWAQSCTFGGGTDSDGTTKFLSTPLAGRNQPRSKKNREEEGASASKTNPIKKNRNMQAADFRWPLPINSDWIRHRSDNVSIHENEIF